MKFLLGFIFALIAVLFVFGSLFGKFIRFMSGSEPRSHKPNGGSKPSNNQAPSRKEFSKDEGQYINYEEVKDEK